MANRYNNSCHRSIKMKPVNVAKENEPMVWMNIYKGKLFPRKTEDLVSITTERGPFKKSSLEGWSEELFHIKQIVKGNPLGTS